MNCKPGDLAMVINGYDCPENVGVLVRVLAMEIDADGPCWFFEDATRPLAFYDFMGTKFFHRSSSESPKGEEAMLEDAALMPIRAEPDDAVDEVIQRLGTPHKETV